MLICWLFRGFAVFAVFSVFFHFCCFCGLIWCVIDCYGCFLLCRLGFWNVWIKIILVDRK